MTQKIIIFGFPHTGTTILKSIIGHCHNVEEIIAESSTIPVRSLKNTEKDFIVCKHPHLIDDFFTDKYSDYIKIFIVRDPRFVFSSLNKRFNYKKLNWWHDLDKYISVIKKFSRYTLTPRKDVYCLKYEDMFPDNFKVLRNMFDDIGFKYSDDVFDNSKYENKILNKCRIPDELPENTDHARYRTYQINQPFKNMNDDKKIDLTEEQLEKITHNEFINVVYPILLERYY